MYHTIPLHMSLTKFTDKCSHADYNTLSGRYSDRPDPEETPGAPFAFKNPLPIYTPRHHVLTNGQ